MYFGKRKKKKTVGENNPNPVKCVRHNYGARDARSDVQSSGQGRPCDGSKENHNTRACAHTHTHTHARTHARTHTHREREQRMRQTQRSEWNTERERE